TTSSAIEAAIALASAEGSPITIEASNLIHVRCGPARLVTIAGSDLKVAASTCRGFLACVASTGAGAELAERSPPRTSMPKSPPAPMAKHVRKAISTTSERGENARCGTEGAFGSIASGSALVASLAMSERVDQIEELVPPAGLLDFRDAAAASVGDACLGDLVVGHGVVGGDVARAQHAGHAQHAHLVVHPHLLAAADHEVAVRQHLRHHGRHQQVDAFRAGDRALSLGRRLGLKIGGEATVALALDEGRVEIVLQIVRHI